jgi:O-succinylbenzoate synthase
MPDAAAVALPSATSAERMAASALEMAVIDCALRTAGESFAQSLGTDRAVMAGAVVGIPGDRSISTLLRSVDEWVGRGYQRVRCKIEPGWDVEPVKEVRAAHPQLHLQVDANGSYAFTRSVDRLCALEEFELDCIEQPLGADDLVAHARLAEQLAIPIGLDESLANLDRLDEALAMGACAVACLKPSRLGGLLAAQAAVERCRAARVGAFVGGFFETGLGRSANAALAGLEGFTLAGDLSHPAEYLEADPFTYPDVVDGRVRPPATPGIAPPPDPELLAACTRHVRWLPAPV